MHTRITGHASQPHGPIHGGLWAACRKQGFSVLAYEAYKDSGYDAECDMELDKVVDREEAAILGGEVGHWGLPEDESRPVSDLGLGGFGV